MASPPEDPSVLSFFSSFLWGFNPNTVLCRSETPQLFTVLPEKRTATVGGAMMGSTHIYDMSTVSTWEDSNCLAGVGGEQTEKDGAEVWALSSSLEMTRPGSLPGYEPEGASP